MVFTVLVHDRQALYPRIQWPGFRHIDHPGVEVSALPRQAFVNGIGDQVGHPAPIFRGRGVGPPGHLLFGEDIPQAEFHPQPAIVF